MKLIQIFAFAFCLALAATTTITVKPTTKGIVTSPVPSKLTTLIKSTQMSASSTTTGSATKAYKICQDMNSSASSGSIQPLDGLAPDDSDWPRRCTFTIVAPTDQKVQMTCSVANLTKIMSYVSSYTMTSSSSLTFGGTLDLYFFKVIIPNRVYTSYTNTMTVTYQVVNSLDAFDCQWTTVKAPATTTDFKWCRDSQATAGSGTIQPLYESPTTLNESLANGIAPNEMARLCPFFINSSPNRQVQTSCSVNFSSPNFNLYTFNGIDDLLSFRLKFNKTTTNANRVELLSVQIAAFQVAPVVCNWTTTTPNTTTKNFDHCLHVKSTATKGIITPLAKRSAADESKICLFSVIASVGQRIQLSCTADNITYYYNRYTSLKLSGITEIMDTKPYLNRVYTSISNRIDLMTSSISNTDWFQCNWTTITTPPTTDFKLCRDGETTAAIGTIQPFDNATVPAEETPPMCRFTIVAPFNKHVRMSCPVIATSSNSTTPPFIALYEFDTFISIIAEPPIVNKVYTSKKNEMNLLALMNSLFWFNCTWIFV